MCTLSFTLDYFVMLYLFDWYIHTFALKQNDIHVCQIKCQKNYYDCNAKYKFTKHSTGVFILYRYKY